MSARIKVLRLLGAAMVTLAVVPWLGGAPAGATEPAPAAAGQSTRATATLTDNATT